MRAGLDMQRAAQTQRALAALQGSLHQRGLEQIVMDRSQSADALVLQPLPGVHPSCGHSHAPLSALPVSALPVSALPVSALPVSAPPGCAAPAKARSVPCAGYTTRCCAGNRAGRNS